MDARLREYATRRRAESGASSSLHPATRRLLQSEVQRVHGKPGDKVVASGQTPWWFRWPGLATLSGAVAGIAVMVVMWSGDESPTDTVLQLAEASSPAGTNVTEPMYRARLDSRVAGERVSERDSLADSGVRGVTQPEMEKKSSEIETRHRSLLLAAAPPPVQDQPLSLAESRSVPPATVPRLVAAGAAAVPQAPSPPATPQPPEITQLFFSRISNPAQTPAPALPPSREPARRSLSAESPSSSSSTGLLDRFELSYSGREAFIRDADGSVYVGGIQPITSLDTAAPASRDSARASEVQGNAIQSPVVVAGRYQINVAGTNRSLNQRVVLQGQLLNLQDSPLLRPGLANAGAVQKAAASGPAARASQSAPAWELQSQVNVGTQQALRIDAIQFPTNSTPTPSQKSP